MTSRTTYNRGLSWMLNGAKLVRQAAREGAEVDEKVAIKAAVTLDLLPPEAVNGIPTVQEIVVRHLSGHGMSTGELARLTGITPESLAGILRDMQRKGSIDVDRSGGRAFWTKRASERAA